MRVCKHGHVALLVGALAAALSGCATSRTAPARQVVTLDELEATAPAFTCAPERVVVPDPAEFRELCQPLGSRLGLLCIRDHAQWVRLRELLRLSWPSPDFDHGMVIGIASWAGLPVDGTWPVRLDSVRVRDGGGLVKATFETGTYLPDGTAYVEAAYVDGLRAVLAVEVNGTAFYPD